MYTYTKKIILIVLFLSIVMPPRLVWAGLRDDINKANEYYTNDALRDAQVEYQRLLEEKPHEGRIHYNLGNTLYKQNQFNNSIKQFRLALLSDNRDLRDKARYNLGNALFYHGLDIESDDIDAAIKALEETLEHYDELLLDNEDDQKVLYNQPLVEKELQRMKQQKQSSTNQQKNQSNEKDSQEKQQQKNNQNQKQNNKQEQQGQSGEQDQQNSSQSQDQKSSQKNTEQNQKNAGNEQENANNNQKEENSSAASSQQDQDTQEQMDRQAAQGDARPADDHQEQDAQSYQTYRVEAMTEDEAKMMLEDYEQNQEPKGMLNFIRRGKKVRPTYQDW